MTIDCIDSVVYTIYGMTDLRLQDFLNSSYELGAGVPGQIL